MLWMAIHSRMCVVGFRRLLLFLYIINDQIKCVTSVIYRMVYMADLIAMCVNRNGANDKGRCVWCVSIVIFWTFFTWTIAPLEQSIVNLNGHPFIAMQMNMQCWCYLVRHKQCRWESWHWTEVVALMLHKCSGIFPLRQVFSNRIIPNAVEHYAAIYYINSRDACHSLLNGISVVLIAFRIKYHASYSVFIAICVW